MISLAAILSALKLGVLGGIVLFGALATCIALYAVLIAVAYGVMMFVSYFFGVGKNP